MSWVLDLCDTYDHCHDNLELQKKHRIAPPFHVTRLAHIEVAISVDGKFRRADAIEPEYTVIPATERSASARTSAVVPHPLCDYVKYCAADAYSSPDEMLTNKHFEGSEKNEGYFQLLKKWHDYDSSNQKISAILKYVSKKRLLQDLVDSKIVDRNVEGLIRQKYEKGEAKPVVFKGTQNKPLNALIRWIVETPNVVGGQVWNDRQLQDSWASFCEQESKTRTSFCFSTGKVAQIAGKHPGGVRGDNAKLISNKAEKDSDFVYLGRFLSASQTANLSAERSFKAHSCLEWLIKRQGYRNGSLVYVAWSPRGTEIPNSFGSTATFFEDEISRSPQASKPNDNSAGQHFGIQLRKKLAGYKATLQPDDNIVVIGLDSATTGRLSLVMYRKVLGSDFLDRIEKWHSDFAWFQNYSNKNRFVGAPSLDDIARVAFGTSLDPSKQRMILSDELKQSSVNRLVPCIVDGTPVPSDFVTNVINRVTRRLGIRDDDWEEALGIACSLIKGTSLQKNKEFKMSLETENDSRDYLYGRLLAIADNIEGYALSLRNEQKRDTAAKRFTQRFSERPYSTWPVIYNHLQPYLSQLRSSTNEKAVGFLIRREKVLDEVMSLFSPSDFTSDKKLEGEFLLGYHCQRRELLKPSRS
jgi:CRISPR-associated protein Csd1